MEGCRAVVVENPETIEFLRDKTKAGFEILDDWQIWFLVKDLRESEDCLDWTTIQLASRQTSKKVPKRINEILIKYI